MTKYSGTSAGPQPPINWDALLKALKPSMEVICSKEDEAEATRISKAFGLDVHISGLLSPEIQFLVATENDITVIKRNGNCYTMRMKSLREQFPIWAS